jgi:hypothetical protein
MEELKVWAGNNEMFFIELLLPVTNNYAFNGATSMLLCSINVVAIW